MSLFNLKNFKGFFIILFLSSIFFAFFGESIYNEQIVPLINKEIDVASGDADIQNGLNGRIGRWERYFDIWMALPFYSKMIGVPTSGSQYSVLMCSNGMHNDYVRNLFAAGIIGVSFYLLFLISIVYRATFFRIPEKFLIIGAVLSIALHSISTVPLAYSAYIYLLFSIISFALLPYKQAYGPSLWQARKAMSKKKVRRIPTVPPVVEKANLTGT